MDLSSSRPSSALGRPASPYSATSNRRVLILDGRFAQHVARIVKIGARGQIHAEVEYGHVPKCAGQSVTLSGGNYVSCDSPTCPALPSRE